MSDNDKNNNDDLIEDIVNGAIFNDEGDEDLPEDLPKDITDNYEEIEEASDDDIDSILNEVALEGEQDTKEESSEESPKASSIIDAEGNEIDGDLANLWDSAMEEQEGSQSKEDPQSEESPFSYKDLLDEQEKLTEEIIDKFKEREGSRLDAKDKFKKGRVVHEEEVELKKVKPAELSRELEGDINLDIWRDIPVTVSLEIGRTRTPIRNVLQLNQGSIVELDKLAGEYLDVLVNGTLIAHGEVVVVNDNFGIRLTDVVSVKERIEKIKE